MNRRKFLTFMGTAGVASALATAKVAEASNVHNFPYYDNGYGVLHDLSRCIGCRQCEAGCNRVNNLGHPHKEFRDATVTRKFRRTTPTRYTVVNQYKLGPGEVVYRKTQCFHCNDPACASACFTKCYTKNPDGSVTYDGTQCVGCRYCMVACPFYIPSFEYGEAFDPLIKKCTFCHDRLEKGELPGCVESCTMDALTFGRRKDLISIARKRIAQNPDKYLDYVYGEHDAGGTAWMVLMPKPKGMAQISPDNPVEAAGAMKKVGLDTTLGRQPMGELTYGALGTVPMIISLWPVLFGGAYGMVKRREAIAKERQDKAVAAAAECVGREHGAEAAERVRAAADAALDEDGASGHDGEEQ